MYRRRWVTDETTHDMCAVLTAVVDESLTGGMSPAEPILRRKSPRERLDVDFFTCWRN
jgi:hypothetical protein